MKKPINLTRNEVLSVMHEEGAWALRQIADHIEKWNIPTKEIIILLREIADEKDAQSIVDKLKDHI